jgi:hypothetical protein
LVNGSAPAPLPLNSNQCLISVGGVVQRPDDTGSEGFRLSGGNIIFSSAPNTGEDFFGVILAGADYVNAGANFPDGTLAAPSITFDQDNDTGYYRSGSGAVSFAANGVAAGTWSSAGLTAPALIPTGSTVPSNGVYLPSTNSVAISTNSTERLRVTSTGLVGIGTTSVTGGQVVINSTLDASNKQLVLRDATNGWARKIGVDSSNNMGFYDGDTERMRIDSSGRLLVGTSSTAENGLITVEGNSDSGTGPGIVRVCLGKDNPTTDDDLGYLVFGDSGHSSAAWIRAKCDGGWTSGTDQPSRLEFSTTADGADEDYQWRKYSFRQHRF